jgi:ABC-type multidrug transport system fused ATPase/permease subunit
MHCVREARTGRLRLKRRWRKAAGGSANRATPRTLGNIRAPVSVCTLISLRRASLALGFGLVLLERLASFAYPIASRYLVDTVVIGRRTSWLIPIASGVTGAAIVQAIAGYWTTRILGTSSHWTVTVVRRSLFNHVVHLPIAYIEDARSGSVVSRVVSDPANLQAVAGAQVAQFAGAVMTALCAFVVLLLTNWRLTLWIMTPLGALVLAAGLCVEQNRSLFRDRAAKVGLVAAVASESLAALRLIKAYSAERAEVRSFTRACHDLFRLAAESVVWLARLQAISGIALGAVTAMTLAIGGHDVVVGRMTLGQFVMCLSAVAMLVSPAMQLPGIATMMSEAWAVLGRMKEIWQVEADRRPDIGGSCARIRDRLEFRGVDFGFQPERLILHDVSFTLSRDTTTALVGPSGAGKSTVVNLLLGLLQPVRGAVMVDDADLSRLSMSEYRARLGVVLQDNFLVNGTVADNIRISRTSASRSDVVRAGRLAYCDEFVQQLPRGYDTLVGERGVKLSVGQRQRIAVARAILREPAVLILDEPTASLDVESECQVQEGLRFLRGRCITLVITHRLATISGADQIIVLERGRIREVGTHEALIRAGGYYATMFARQTEGAANNLSWG